MLDLDWQIQIIEQLIKENPESTIADFLDVIKEVEQVAEGNKIKDEAH